MLGLILAPPGGTRHDSALSPSTTSSPRAAIASSAFATAKSSRRDLGDAVVSAAPPEQRRPPHPMPENRAGALLTCTRLALPARRAILHEVPPVMRNLSTFAVTVGWPGVSWLIVLFILHGQGPVWLFVVVYGGLPLSCTFITLRLVGTPNAFVAGVISAGIALLSWPVVGILIARRVA